MSINHFSSDVPERLWWTQQQPMMEPPPPTPNSPSSNHKILIPQRTHIYNPHQQIWLGSQEAAAAATMFRHRRTNLNFNLNQEDNEEEITDERENNEVVAVDREEDVEEVVEREAMFEKPLTPSDVGKLNRLVIPKQHAEKHFPLGGDLGDKGSLLSFEDESGKCWRFRYSYWNSSQSYVLTKGWSRYVKEKRLDAGDVVLFQRHKTDGDRLFIGWRRRVLQQAQDSGAAQPPHALTTSTTTTTTTTTTTGGWTRVFYSAHPYPSHPLPYHPPDCLHAGSVNMVGQNETTPVGNSKRLRLFGVNLECQLDHESEPATPDGSSSSSQGQTHHQFYPEAHDSSAHLLNMDMNMSRDVNLLMRNRRG